MYFQSRAEAGLKLATELSAYRYEDTVVVALNSGAVQVGMQIASVLHATLTLMLSEKIDIPGENVSVGVLDQSGKFVYNSMFSDGQIDEYYSEFHGFIEDQKRVKMSQMNRLLGSGGIVDEAMLREQNVILLSDALDGSYSLDAAEEFIKPLKIKRLVVATPIASVSAVDRAHLLADELHVLAVTDNFLDVDHYYEVNDVPDFEEVVKMLNDFVLSWR